MNAPQPSTVEFTLQRASSHQVDQQWRPALAEYGHLAAADQNNLAAHTGVAWALAKGGYLDESYRVLGTALYRSTLSEVERRRLLDMLREEAGPADPYAKVEDVAAAEGLLVWRHSRWWGAYLALMIVISVLPLVVGMAQQHYPSITFGALTGSALIYLYITRHRVPAWRPWDPERHIKIT